MEEAIRRGSFYVQGSLVTPAKSASAKKLVDTCLERLVDVVYPKLTYIDKNYNDDAEIKRILNGAEQALPGQQPNARAIEELERKLKGVEAQRHNTVTMGDIQRLYQSEPYGWPRGRHSRPWWPSFWQATAPSSATRQDSHPSPTQRQPATCAPAP